MCGLVGIISKQAFGFVSKDSDIFQQMLYSDALRGWDATGVFGINEQGNVDIKKSAVAAGPFLSSTEFNEFKRKLISDYKIVIGHNRKATHGEKRHEDAHPFWDDEDKICLVHNGMISNYKEFCKESTVDSHAICRALATSSPQEVFSRVEGPFAFIWYNVAEKTLYMIRNEHRPLFYGDGPNGFYLASEPVMVHWICNRNDVELTSIKSCKERVLYSFNLEKKELLELEQIPLKKKTVFPTIIIPSRDMHTTQTTTQNGRGVVCNVPKRFGKSNPNFYLTDDDLKTKEDAIRLIKKNDLLALQISSYEKLKNKSTTCLYATIANITVPWLSVELYVTNEIADSLDLTSVILAKANSIITRADKNGIIVFCSDPTEEPTTSTANDVIITNEMYWDDTFPASCDCCGEPIKWHHLPDSYVWFENQSVETLICPTCSKGQHNAC